MTENEMQVEAEKMEALANQIVEVCSKHNSTIILGAMYSLIVPIIKNAPNKAYRYACADFLERQGKQLKAEMRSD